jgi:HEPN domain-containing protein
MEGNRKAAERWLDRAKDDLAWSRASVKESIFHGACFSAQQAGEKSLKAFLVLHGKPVAKIHDLGALVERCHSLDPTFEDLREVVMPLTDYYLQARYPDIADFIHFSKKKADDALTRAETTVAFVEKRFHAKEEH